MSQQINASRHCVNKRWKERKKICGGLKMLFIAEKKKNEVACMTDTV